MAKLEKQNTKSVKNKKGTCYECYKSISDYLSESMWTTNYLRFGDYSEITWRLVRDYLEPLTDK